MDRRELLKQNDSAVYTALINEEKRITEWLELIPSENYTYPEAMELLWSVFTDKYAEGYPGKRYYGWNENVDVIESLAIERAKELFRAEHVNVQPLSWSPMNQAVYFAVLNPWDTVLAMDLSHGWHLTHGHPVSHMSKIFNFIRYKSNPDNEWKIDFEELMKLAIEHKPKMILCGYSSYPRDYDYADFKKVADAVGAITMADVAHIWWLIAGWVMRNPLDYGFDIMTTTTHKSLRWPRWWMILCKKEFAAAIDKSVFPWLQWWPHENNIWALAVTLWKALKPEFKEYANQVMKNSKTLAQEFLDNWIKLVTGWTDNHMMVINTVESFWIDWKVAQETLEKTWISLNKQVIPDDTNPPMRPSWIRLWTPAVTSTWMKEEEMKKIANWIIKALKNPTDEILLSSIKSEIKALRVNFVVPALRK